MTTQAGPIPDQLAVIACLFAPELHERRRRNFDLFRKQFRQELYVAELVYDGQRPLTHEDSNTFHFRGSARHVLWQKERLMNEALRRLPRSVTAVAWVDADVIFVDQHWASQTMKQLEQFPVVQLFDTVVHLDAEGFPSSRNDGIVASAAANGPNAYEQRTGAAGFAWAARRDLLDELKLLDPLVLGGADTYMACGFAGVRPSPVFAHLPPEVLAAVVAWSERAQRLTGGRVGFVPGTIEHLFHGSLRSRGYLQRYELMRRAHFNPATDLVLEPTGLFAWRKPTDGLPAGVAAYFHRRTEAENLRAAYDTPE